jgi:hypothetical protein
MINFSFGLEWPLKKEKNSWSDSIFYWDELITKNKAFSIQFDKGLWGGCFPIIGINFNYWLYQDHAGPKLELQLLGLTLILNLYDRRHWHYDQGRWMTDQEMQDDVPDPGRR